MDKPPPPGFNAGAMPEFAPAPPPYTDTQQQAPPPPQAFIVQPTPIAFGPQSQRMTCPQCQSSISTRVEAEPNMKTHIVALILCLLGLWCCSPCPYCVDSCLVKKHYCPSCKNFLGQTDN